MKGTSTAAVVLPGLQLAVSPAAMVVSRIPPGQSLPDRVAGTAAPVLPPECAGSPSFRVPGMIEERAERVSAPRMEDHQREGVMRCAGCWLIEAAQFTATPSTVEYAQQLVVQTLLTWAIDSAYLGPARMAVADLVRWAIEENTDTDRAPSRRGTSERPVLAIVGVNVVRHSDGIMLEVADAIPRSPLTPVYLGLPQPYGIHWFRDESRRITGRLVWCGIRYEPESPPSPRLARSLRVTGGYRSPPGSRA